MKTQLLVLCLVLITIDYSISTFAYDCEFDTNPTKKSDCTSVVGDSEDDGYCCFVEAKSGNSELKNCEAITKSEYNNLNDYKNKKKEEAKKKDMEYSKYDISCPSSSAFLKIGLVILSISLLF